MDVLIIEDEIVAAQSLQRMLATIDPTIHILSIIQSVEESVEWFRCGNAADLVFMDIHLADGSAFSIFEQVEVSVPVVFTTAYDQYAIDAFRVNSIDYLLKPIQLSDLRRALEKYNRLASPKPALDPLLLSSLNAQLSSRSYKSFFLIPFKDRLLPVSVSEIACLFLGDGCTRMMLLNGTTYTVEKPLDAYMQQLDPRKFFRANRQYVIAQSAIKDISVWFGGKLSISLSVNLPERIVISKARVSEFKDWFTC